MKLEGKSLKVIFTFYYPIDHCPVGILALYHGRRNICGKRSVRSGINCRQYLNAIYNGAVFHLYPVCGGKFDNRGDSSGTGRKKNVQMKCLPRMLCCFAHYRF